MLGSGYWMLDDGCWMLDVGCSKFDAGAKIPLLAAGFWQPAAG
jgi:hypothetical protein